MLRPRGSCRSWTSLRESRATIRVRPVTQGHPGASLQILKGLARDEGFDNDPEYFKDWQTGEGAPKNMCRLHYDCE